MKKRNPRVMRGRRLLITITIDPDLVHEMDEIADERRTSRAQIVRESIVEYLKAHREKQVA